MILSNTMIGELWIPMPGKGHIHLGSYHMDTNVFQETEEDGIPGETFDISGLPDEGWIIVKGSRKLHKSDFSDFRIKWLRGRFPSLHWN